MIATEEVLEELCGFNESEVRFHIIDPMLRKLGYAGRQDVYLKLEEKLEYPYYYIGRKTPRKTLLLDFLTTGLV